MADTKLTDEQLILWREIRVNAPLVPTNYDSLRQYTKLAEDTEIWLRNIGRRATELKFDLFAELEILFDLAAPAWFRIIDEIDNGSAEFDAFRWLLVSQRGQYGSSSWLFADKAERESAQLRAKTTLLVTRKEKEFITNTMKKPSNKPRAAQTPLLS